MKSKNILLITLLTLLTSMSVMLTSCDVKNPVDGLEVRIKNISRNTYLSAKIFDAATGDLVTKNVEVKFSGESKDKIISSTNTPITSLNTTQGLIAFSLADDLIPSASTPVKLNLVCSASGYINTSKPIQIYEEGTSEFRIVMTSVDNTPDGVISNTESTGSSDASGATTEPIAVSSGNDISSGASAAISIPAGTVLLDENNNPLTGAISSTVTYFNPLDESSTNSFPGGFNVNVEDENGVESSGGFVTAGFVSIDLTVGGQSVEGFSNGSLDIDIEVPQETINPTTGETVKVGDIIPLWSYNEDLGKWKFEQEVEVTTLIPTAGLSKMSNNMGVIVSGINHLTYFNLGWFIEYGPKCTTAPILRITNTLGGCFKAEVIIHDFKTSHRVTFSEPFTVSGDGVVDVNLYNSIGDMPVAILVRDPLHGGILGYVEVDDLCAAEVIDIPFTPTLVGFEQITINLTIKCDSETDTPRGVILDNIPLFAREVSSSGTKIGDDFQVGSLEDGKLVACLKTGAFYEFFVEYDSNWYYSLDYADPFEITSTVIDYEIIDDPDICANF